MGENKYSNQERGGNTNLSAGIVSISAASEQRQFSNREIKKHIAQT